MPGDQQRADRAAGHQAVDDQRNARRDDRADRRRDAGDREGEVVLVARLAHRLDLDRAEARRVGGGRARHARKDHAGDDVHMPEPAPQPAHRRFGEVEDAGGDVPRVHDLPRVEEEGDGEQQEVIEPVDRFLRDDLGAEGAEPALQNHQDGGRAAHRDRHGDADQKRRDEDDQVPDSHLIPPPFPVRRPAAPGGAQGRCSRARRRCRRWPRRRASRCSATPSWKTWSARPTRPS